MHKLARIIQRKSPHLWRPAMQRRYYTKPSFRMQVIAVDTDASHIVQHLATHFYCNEPLNLVYGLQDDAASLAEMMHEYRLTIAQGLSLAAYDTEHGCLAGCVINGCLVAGDQERNAEQVAERRTPAQMQHHLIYSQAVDLQLFRRYGVGEIFEVRALSVDPVFQGLGLSRSLLECAVQLAQLRGFRLMQTDATSAFSQRSFERVGFESLAEISYDELPDFVRLDSAEHRAKHGSVKVMVKQLCDRGEGE